MRRDGGGRERWIDEMTRRVEELGRRVAEGLGEAVKGGRPRPRPRPLSRGG